MKPMRGGLAWGLVGTLLLVSCAKRVPLAEPTGTKGAAIESIPNASIPLDVQEFQVANADGHRGVFLKLSRLPDAVEHHSESDPARIILEIKGPTGEEVPEAAFPGRDTLVARVRVSRSFGVLRVALDLQGDDPPRYSVHTMADWIMIRLAPMDLSQRAAGPGRG